MSSNNAPKKSLGQHWLFDQDSLEAMCDAADVGANDLVLEVGPGLGTLTDALLRRSANVWTLEYDESLIPALLQKFADYDSARFRVEHADVLRYDFGKLPSGYKIVANIPYYLTSNLLRRICEAENHFSRAALLVQKEVAERVFARPGNMSLLSVSVQFYCDVSLGMVVPAHLFTPPPKVDSQILILSYRVQPLFPDVDTKKFFQIVKAGFSERRKKLRSSLSGGLHISKQKAEELLNQAGIDPNLRAQALSLDDWHRLYTVTSKTL